MRQFLLLLILICNLGCDQISKLIVRKEIDEYQNIEIIGSYLTLTKVENTGAFLSAGSDLPDFVKFIFLAIMPMLALCFGLFYMFTRKHLSWLSGVALAFAIGGGVGNIYDRIIFGSVTDFVHMDFGFFQTGIFNMADVSLLVSVFIFFFQSKQKRQP